ncbi:long-chain fatty acid--CoA ligase [Actinoplanes sp. NPDC049265]|uniref:acyl-CoA synthetase n=1 Tax=Actinoplanes sp. NPDC049265 TaxID=3363902 RepID=UPI0037127A6C
MRNQGLGSWPARRARMSPARVALTHQGVDITYAGLAARAQGFAHRLRRLGVRRGDRIAYLGVNHPHAVLTLFAAGLLGAVHLPLNARLTRDELMVIVGDAEPAVVVAGPGHESMAAGLGVPAVVVSGDETGEPIDELVGLDDLAVIMYTSGTTGRPKGTMLTHGNLTWNVCNHLIDIDLRGDDVVLVAAPLFHIAALAQSLLPILVKGGRAVLEPSFDPRRALATIAAERVTVMFGVPTMFALMARSSDFAGAELASLRILECGGAPVPEPLIREYADRGVLFLQGYGMTEAAPGVLYLAAEDAAAKPGTAGVPVFFSDVRVVAPDGRDTADDEPGEIMVAGPNVFGGYWGMPEETAAVLDNGWFRSGDIGVRDGDGFHRIVDRARDMIISGGENVYPAEVENALLGCPGVAECAVIGVPDEKWGEVGKALIVRSGPDVTAGDVLRGLDGRLARFKVPRYVEFVAELPRTASGKLLKARLRREYGGSSEGTPA